MINGHFVLSEVFLLNTVQIYMKQCDFAVKIAIELKLIKHIQLTTNSNNRSVCIFRWHTILTRISSPSQKTIYNFKLVVGHTTKHMKQTVVRATLKYDEPEVENAHEGAARVRHFQPRVHYFNAQSLPCIICIQYTACCRRIYSVSAIIYNSS